MRQAGIIAAAGIYALEHHVQRLAIDHENARALAEGLIGIPGLEIDMKSIQTNMVFGKLLKRSPEDFERQLKDAGVLAYPDKRLRLVTHLDVSAEDIRNACEIFRQVLRTTE